MHDRKTFITRHSVIQRRSDLIIIPRMRTDSPIQKLCLCWPLRSYFLHLELLSLSPSRRDDLSLSCLLTQALMPLGRLANLNYAIGPLALFDYITLHFLLLVGCV